MFPHFTPPPLTGPAHVGGHDGSRRRSIPGLRLQERNRQGEDAAAALRLPALRSRWVGGAHQARTNAGPAVSYVGAQSRSAAVDGVSIRSLPGSVQVPRKSSGACRGLVMCGLEWVAAHAWPTSRAAG